MAGGEQGETLLASSCLIFGDFRFNVPTRELLRVGNHGSATPISLGSRAADLLHLFLHRPGELITKNEIMDAVWPNMAVEESNLTVQISALRRALGGRKGASYIQTVPGRGYRFTPWTNDAAPEVKDTNWSEAIALAGAAGAREAETAEPTLQHLNAALPESAPRSSPHTAVPSPIPAASLGLAALRPQKTSTWWLFCLQGMAGIILGLMLLSAPGATAVELASFLGLYWLIMGVLALVRVFVDQAVPSLWSLLVGIVGILSAIFVARHPLLAALTVPMAVITVLGAQGLIMGGIEIAGGFMGGGIASFVLGVTYLLAGLLLLGSLIVAAPAAPVIFGLLFLAQGVVLTVFAFRARA